ncbi:family 10 glycosylhydrolase [Flavobacterium nackdongense]|uniref:T9SS type A sorting domain-containing protein n=1 Tax=Flavobacterium nackdongense TaxID=2547394 RepID=A0A4P6YBI0_9FLAO|nr:family 10 glycosylhydrolase [Flavobacterium nackdongense]QBN17680.1 T9SS type A sorting domain-containing protein [Flavobacterium nackdongense]
MKSKVVFFALVLFSVLNIKISVAQCVTGSEFNKSTPKRDLRGVFVASVFNLNWPTNRTASPAVQQAELIAILDNLKLNGYNTVFLQVRSECDALYPSLLEPWSQWLTGTQGLAPSPVWDPLAFAVTEAHNRGLELHAWLNPYRAQTSSTATYPKASNHIINTNPSWVFTSSTNVNLKILDPGIPAVTTYITSIVQDIATRYNVDGIHFDDYFYPAGGMIASPGNQDAASYAAYNPGGLTLFDWRRDNVNKMIASVFDAIQTINTANKKNIIFGVSPFGIWKSGTPAGISGQSSYNDLYCDPIAWLNAGKVDYLAPQLYWKITGGQDYIALSKWWNDQIKAKNKQLYVSQAYYKMVDSNNWAATEIQNQVNQNRVANMDATFGQIAYSYTNIKSNSKTINEALNGAQFKYKSFAPPIAGKDDFCPEKPSNIRFGTLKIMWDTPAAAVDDNDLPEKYVVYAFANAAEAITNMNDGSKIVDIVVGNELAITQEMMDTKHFVVSSLDKNNNEAGDFNTTLGNSSFDAPVSPNFLAYPNPFVDSFYLNLKNSAVQMARISIFDATGKQVWEQNIASTNSSIVISPSNLNSGIYFAKVGFENGTSESFKIIKN